MKHLTLILLLLSFAAPTGAGEIAWTVRSTEIKKEPYSDAKTVTTLPEKTAVNILERKGGWVRITGKAGKGWVKLLSLRSSSPGKTGSSGLQNLVNIARTGSSGVTVTTGVRGLDEEDIRNAQANPRELEKLERYAVDRDEAEQFARAAKLKTQTMDYLP